ncbi:hypothetical protein ACFQX7_07130 [Luedemannella flava]
MTPLPGETLDELFGTRRPSVAAVEEAVGRCGIDGFGRDQGAYLVAHDGDRPAFIYFGGHSGD